MLWVFGKDNFQLSTLLGKERKETSQTIQPHLYNFIGAVQFLKAELLLTCSTKPNVKKNSDNRKLSASIAGISTLFYFSLLPLGGKRLNFGQKLQKWCTSWYLKQTGRFLRTGNKTMNNILHIFSQKPLSRFLSRGIFLSSRLFSLRVTLTSSAKWILRKEFPQWVAPGSTGSKEKWRLWKVRKKLFMRSNRNTFSWTVSRCSPFRWSWIAAR